MADLKALTKELGLQDHVRVMGKVPHNQLKTYFDTHNIGLCFIPITPFFDVQPSTKLFEYLLSGMPVIATATYENKSVIHPGNGVLIQDTEKGVYEGLSRIWQLRKTFDAEKIRNHSRCYTWETVIHTLEDLLERL